MVNNQTPNLLATGHLGAQDTYLYKDSLCFFYIILGNFHPGLVSVLVFCTSPWWKAITKHKWENIDYLRLSISQSSPNAEVPNRQDPRCVPWQSSDELCVELPLPAVCYCTKWIFAASLTWALHGHCHPPHPVLSAEGHSWMQIFARHPVLIWRRLAPSVSIAFRCLKFKLTNMINVAVVTVAETKPKKGINTKLWLLMQPGSLWLTNPRMILQPHGPSLEAWYLCLRGLVKKKAD